MRLPASVRLAAQEPYEPGDNDGAGRKVQV
jgi:hypothetical protein